MNLINVIACIAIAMRKYDLYIGVIYQYPQHFAARISSAANNTRLDFI